MKKEFINEAKRFQKLAGLINENELNENNQFNTPKELADFLNQHKEEFFGEFRDTVIEYVIDAMYEQQDIQEDFENIINNWDKYENSIKQYWMKPDMLFNEEEMDDETIVNITYPGSYNVDMSGYGWFINTPNDYADKIDFLGKVFWQDYN